ncbi:MAG: homoserine O-acetyltransferase family protein [Candidatus Sericytochromatia bacterium]
MSPSPTPATGLLTDKRVQRLSELPLACGATLTDVAVGYETYGRLNADGDNAILVCHHFSGSSHAAGRYATADEAPGWWDAVIGPGKAIDTDRFFVVAMDALGCVRRDSPHGVTTSAMSPNPATGRPYGPDFPPIAPADMVESQRRVLDALGVGRLVAVAGPSLGAVQAFAWADRYPRDVDRIIAAIGPTELQAKEIGLYRVMEDAIRLDPAFQAGRYDPESPPLNGLTVALKLMMLLAGGREALMAAWGRSPADGEGIEWAMEAWLDREARDRAGTIDANAWISMLRANMRWDLRAGRDSLEAVVAGWPARVLLLPAVADELIVPGAYHAPLESALRATGADLRVQVLPAAHGHLAGLSDIAFAADAIRDCLESPLTR